MAIKHRTDEEYLKPILTALKVCRNYRPKFGHGSKAGYSLDEFAALYQQDAFYCWFGLDSPLVYAAHKAAGGLTSVYRQIGIGCQWVFHLVLQDSLGLSALETTWSYTVPSAKGKERKLSLDGRIPSQGIADKRVSERVRKWLQKAADIVKLAPEIADSLHGAVFEVRQGYKSKDSKRQNADISNAANAYANAYLPVVLLLSSQIDSDIAERYARSQWLILRGTLTGSTIDSTYVFCREVLKYDLAAFFGRNKGVLKKELEKTFESLLT
jgi:hypothetical protein